MVTVHFFDNSTNVLTQLRQEIPNVEQEIKIKGRKGKILSVIQLKEDVFQANVEFEKIVKKAAVAADSKKRKR
ncbi:hypothetical protein ACTQ5K_12400 [Niallia sp. Sow4_A1]|uniref:Preprotein translocase subunit SecA n=1 Tax=Niallia hominis TaxID=3133173 RepID=A0ABV1F047_9BACI|nr:MULTISPECIES: hypothetical protein [Bacillaceae]MCF2649749.1 hypothetical protein [Niallia circulans]MCM3362189.1 hypothetical protein [Niallia sp. MER TA 168]